MPLLKSKPKKGVPKKAPKKVLRKKPPMKAFTPLLPIRLTRKPPAPPTKKKARPVMTTAPASEVRPNPTSSEHSKKAKPTGDYPGKGGQPIEEMTHEEHKAYLIREAEENEKINDEIYKMTVDDIPDATELLLPTSTTNDDLREKALEQTKAAAKAASTPKVPYKAPEESKK